MHAISNILFWISTGLLVPVIVILIFLFIRSIILLGGFFGQYMTLRKTDKTLHENFQGLNAENVAALNEKLPEKSDSLVVQYIRQMLQSANNPANIQRLLANFEIAADKDLALAKSLTKLGPILGLMSTLIPMGPALIGLASGDIGSMAYNMQVAFATTVVGLFVSAIGFIVQQVKQRWFLQDLTNLEFLAEVLNEKRNAR